MSQTRHRIPGSHSVCVWAPPPVCWPGPWAAAGRPCACRAPSRSPPSAPSAPSLPLVRSLYTVVPYLVRFIDSLTNVYVRYNRKRLKGRNGPEDTATALAALFHVLLTVCKVMAPFTPFFTGARGAGGVVRRRCCLFRHGRAGAASDRLPRLPCPGITPVPPSPCPAATPPRSQTRYTRTCGARCRRARLSRSTFVTSRPPRRRRRATLRSRRRWSACSGSSSWGAPSGSGTTAA